MNRSPSSTFLFESRFPYQLETNTANFSRPWKTH